MNSLEPWVPIEVDSIHPGNDLASAQSQVPAKHLGILGFKQTRRSHRRSVIEVADGAPLAIPFPLYSTAHSCSSWVALCHFCCPWGNITTRTGGHLRVFHVPRFFVPLSPPFSMISFVFSQRSSQVVEALFTLWCPALCTQGPCSEKADALVHRSKGSKTRHVPLRVCGKGRRLRPISRLIVRLHDRISVRKSDASAHLAARAVCIVIRASGRRKGIRWARHALAPCHKRHNHGWWM